MATVMNEDQIKIIVEALSEALDIINRNQLKVIDEKFDAIFDGKGEADSAEQITEDRIREIAEDEARDLINGASISA
jgi:hypothetical protein|tara:strand:+ start:254 stop:484 length:231 start_codon:yes stop_codon:yes gene_type:complete